MARRFLTVSAILASAFGAVSSASVLKDVPGCTLAEAENCGLNFIPFFLTARLAETAKELEQHCKLFRGQLQCLQNFTRKCLEGIPKGAVAIAVGAASDEYDILCNTTSPIHKEFLDNVKCINKAGPEVRKCIQDFFVDLHRASTAPVKQQIGYSCCYYQDFVQCTEKRLTSKCDSPAAVKYLNLIIENVIGEGLSLVCGKYEKDACDAFPTLSKKDDSNFRGKGFIGPLATIAGNFG